MTNEAVAHAKKYDNQKGDESPLKGVPIIKLFCRVKHISIASVLKTSWREG